jgi:UDP-N-acetylglucosamine--N-acetylmuramyl-(pentapeptide) pyrophosphoryl-undecaprenol N-acetylglucosamine transferase
MRVIIAGGGTGGHIFPAVSIAEEIMETDKNNEILFIGTKRGMEGKLIASRGFNIDFIRSYPILGKSIMFKLKGVIYALVGMYESIKIFNKFNPEMVVGVGGYVSGPVVLSAYIKRIPRVICEQNSIPGITNRVLSYFANRIFVTFEKSKSFFSREKTLLTGNPIQKKFSSADLINEKKSAPNEFNILILGGSQGAKKLNDILPQSIAMIDNKNISLVHQTGEEDYKDVLDKYFEHKIDAAVYEFIENIEDFYLAADLVIARSGAGTIAEICSVGKPSILIPFPFATHNHQYHNARVLQEHGAALLIEEQKLDCENLSSAIKGLLDLDKLKKMGDKAKELGKPDAAKVIVENMYKLLNKEPCMGV